MRAWKSTSEAVMPALWLVLLLVFTGHPQADARLEVLSSAESLKRTTGELEGQTRVVSTTDALVVYRLPGSGFAKSQNADFTVSRLPSYWLIQLEKGGFFLNLGPEGLEQKVILEFAGLSLHATGGDFLILIENEGVRVQCFDGSGYMETGLLKLPLEAGYELRVQRSRLSEPEPLHGRHLRAALKWYESGFSWPLPPMFESFQMEQQRPRFTQVLLNGLPLRGSSEKPREVFYGDLIMGRIRLEARLEDRPVYQQVQVSLNGGQTFRDLGKKDEILLQLKPEERQYDLVFRLRDEQKSYPIDHPRLSFVYRSDSMRPLVLDWLMRFRRAWQNRQDRALYGMLSKASTLPVDLLAALRRSSRDSGSRSIRFSLEGLTDFEGRIRAVVAFEKRTSRESPGVSRGVWTLSFQRGAGDQLQLVSEAGKNPLQLSQIAADRQAPRISTSARQIRPGTTGVRIRLVVSDTLSPIAGLKLCRESLLGHCEALRPLDGELDSQREVFSVFVPPTETASRLLFEAKDTAGVVSHPVIVSLVRN